MMVPKRRLGKVQMFERRFKRRLAVTHVTFGSIKDTPEGAHPARNVDPPGDVRPHPPPPADTAQMTFLRRLHANQADVEQQRDVPVVEPRVLEFFLRRA